MDNKNTDEQKDNEHKDDEQNTNEHKDNKVNVKQKKRKERGDYVNIYINRIVAAAFIPNPDPTKYKYVEHINTGIDKEGKHDNRAENLKWVP